MNPWYQILLGIILFFFICPYFVFSKDPAIKLFAFWFGPITIIVGIIRLFI
jgi:hypothetical protein